MSDKLNYLLTFVYNGNQLVKVAVQFKKDEIKESAFRYFKEPENQALIKSKLPLHCQDLGFLIEVEEIFEVIEVK